MTRSMVLITVGAVFLNTIGKSQVGQVFNDALPIRSRFWESETDLPSIPITNEVRATSNEVRSSFKSYKSTDKVSGIGTPVVASPTITTNLQSKTAAQAAQRQAELIQQQEHEAAVAAREVELRQRLKAYEAAREEYEKALKSQNSSSEDPSTSGKGYESHTSATVPIVSPIDLESPSISTNNHR